MESEHPYAPLHNATDAALWHIGTCCNTEVLFDCGSPIETGGGMSLYDVIACWLIFNEVVLALSLVEVRS